MEREKKKREIEAMDVMLLCNNYELGIHGCMHNLGDGEFIPAMLILESCYARV
jgi:hypothetical protein